MGIRGELFSTKVSLQNRTYFFNVKENRMGDLYLNIVESKNKDTGGFDRQSVVLFADDLTDFLKGFDESLKVMEKANREKRKTAFAKAKSSREERGDWDRDGQRGERGEHAPASSAGRPPRKTKSGKPMVLKKTGRAERKGDAGPKKPPRKPRAVRAVRRDDRNRDE